MRVTAREPFEILCDAHRRMGQLAEQVHTLRGERGLPSRGGSTSADIARQRLFRLVLDFCDRLCLALQTAERRVHEAHDVAAALKAAQALHAVEQILWQPLDDVGSVLFRWVQRRPQEADWEVDYLGLEYHFERHGSAFIAQLLRLDAGRLEQALTQLRPPTPAGPSA